MRRALWLALWISGCAVEGSTQTDTELRALEAQSQDAVAKVRGALADPQLPFGLVAEGERAIDGIGRAGANLAADSSLSDHQRMKAAMLEARAYDDLAQALERPIARPLLSPEEQAVLTRALEDRARPARASARGGFEHAQQVVCSLGSATHPFLLEILDGLSRYGADPPATGKPCD